MHVGLLQQARCAPVFSDFSHYGFNKGQDWSWMSFPNNPWVQLSDSRQKYHLQYCGQKWGHQPRSYTLQKNNIKYRCWPVKRIGRVLSALSSPYELYKRNVPFPETSITNLSEPSGMLPSIQVPLTESL